ncbi:hypothetical protein, partial [Bradyrhizobium sp.]|uniref:hypothetical protein n=1 Tax=Bradyrhizobium sp. TaxID=376 RepID=UPI003C561798
MPPLTRKLTGDHCFCGTCGEYFNSTCAFDMHRVGSFRKNARRCLSVQEMTEIGMVRSKTDWWITKEKAKGPQPVRPGQ